ncbi:UPF0688 protein C1orf174 [Willisornis vidua]|uniref:UPF0688 protein C1orf174 n=1 Tax=Willisornis vidua TaxID=1566151 RepID=A0ABQ9DGB2_9PASS|nr:UPF0688 protein C1orf174 [Willisornis vidua]
MPVIGKQILLLLSTQKNSAILTQNTSPMAGKGPHSCRMAVQFDRPHIQQKCSNICSCEIATTCPPNNMVTGENGCSSHTEDDGQPAKRVKCEKSSTESELEGLTCGSENLAALGEMTKASDGDQGSEDPGDTNIIQQRKAESIPETDEAKQDEEHVSLEPHAVRSSSAPLKMGSGGYLHRHVFSEEESSCGSVLAEESGSEDTDRPRRLLQLEHSGFSDEDSNQPMPVHRFFGDFEPDLPAVPLPSTTMSRREVRNLHFIAKEDEEEEEEEDVV